MCHFSPRTLRINIWYPELVPFKSIHPFKILYVMVPHGMNIEKISKKKLNSSRSNPIPLSLMYFARRHSNSRSDPGGGAPSLHGPRATHGSVSQATPRQLSHHSLLTFFSRNFSHAMVDPSRRRNFSRAATTSLLRQRQSRSKVSLSRHHTRCRQLPRRMALRRET